MCVLIVSTTFVWNIYHPKETPARYYHKRTVGFIKGVLLWCQIFNEIWIISTDFRKIFIYKISWNSVQWDASFSTRMNRRVEIA